MTSLILVAILGQSCQQAVVQKQAVRVVQQQAYAVAAEQHGYANQIVVPYVDPYYRYVVGDEREERLRKLEENIEQLTTIAAQNARIIESLRGQGASGPGESAAAVKARELIATHCLKCHSGEDAKSGLRLDGPIDVATKILVNDVVISGAMPPKPAEPLSDTEAAIVAEWAMEDKAALRAFLRSSSKRE